MNAKRSKTLPRKNRFSEAEPVPQSIEDDGFAVDDVREQPSHANPSSQTGFRLGDMLVKRRLVTAASLKEALMAQRDEGKRLGQVLVEMGALDERRLIEVLAEQLDLPVVDLRVVEPEEGAIACLSEELARELSAIPIRLVDDGVEIAVADPTDLDIELRLREAAGRPVFLVLAPVSDIRRTQNTAYRALAAVEQQVSAFQATETARRATEAMAADLGAEDAPVVRVVDLIVTQALRDRASDIHIEPQDGRVRVRYRIDGALHYAAGLPVNIGPALVSRIKIMAGMNILERRRAQDGQIAMNIEGRSLDIRVSTAPTIWGEKTVLRLLDKSKPVFRLDDLGMPADTREVFSKLIRSPFGMVMCAGPTGSGKTTTLYASLMEINDMERNITTIEDPVEYVFPSINQIQINEQAGVTFAGGLRSILRQDPDVILVGEIRDVETARIAAQSALTGHFVLSSIHATDAASALHRFMDMGIEPFLITSALVGVVGQRLMRRVCRECREPYKPDSDELAFYKGAGGKPKTKFFRGRGCNFCAQTGYQERIGVYELLRVTEEMKLLIVKEPSHEQIRKQAVKDGMKTLRDEAINLVTSDVTTISEVVRSIYTM